MREHQLRAGSLVRQRCQIPEHRTSYNSPPAFYMVLDGWILIKLKIFEQSTQPQKKKLMHTGVRRAIDYCYTMILLAKHISKNYGFPA